MLTHKGTQMLETDRLILRRNEMSDVEDMFRNWETDPEVSRFWGWEPHKDVEETRSLLSRMIADYAKEDTYNWVIVYKSDPQAIGFIYLSEIDEKEDSLAVHYLLSRPYWNQGLMTEACGKVIEFAFSELGVRKIHSRHHADNLASGRVMQKCGMRLVKTAYHQVPDCERISGEYCFYEMTRDLIK